MNPPRTVSDLFPSKWLKADDLRGRTATVTIQAVSFEELKNPQTHKAELKAILSFKGKEKRLPLNITQCHALTTITGSDEFAHWPGHTIAISPARSHNGKDTINISRPPQSEAEAPAAAQAHVAEAPAEPTPHPNGRPTLADINAAIFPN